ncbi:hypothetical protein HDV00_012186 [Rhizophlyctis rosea]|nr:hypothetical protein HDV00_012186 [Rhizophlyctis rosea]
MQNTIFSLDNPLFEYRSNDYTKYVAILPGGGENVSPFTTQQQLAIMKKSHSKKLKSNLPKKLRKQLKDADPDQSYPAKFSILSTLPDLPMAQATVVVGNPGLAEVGDNLSEYTTWDERDDVELLGSAEYMYWLCKEGRNLREPQLEVKSGDYDVEANGFFHREFMRWYDKRNVRYRGVFTK